MKPILFITLLTLLGARVLAQSIAKPNPKPVLVEQPSKVISDDPRLGQPIWRVTFCLLSPSAPPLVTALGDVYFVDNGLDENELEFSESCREETGLMDAFWAIKRGQSRHDELVIYSNGEVIKSVGSLTQGRYQLRYTRQGKPVSMLLERIEN